MKAYRIVWRQRERVFECRQVWVYKVHGKPWGHELVVPVLSPGHEDPYPLAPGHKYMFVEPTYLAVRLLSTRGQRLQYWRISERARHGLNEAPFEPIWRGWVSQFMWAPEGKEFREEREDLVTGDWDVLQGSTGGWWTWGAKMAEDQAPYMRAPMWHSPVPAISAVLGRLELRTSYARQGHLVVYQVDAPFGECREEEEWKREPVRFYNHCVARAVVLGRRGTRVCIYTREPTWVLSPDHVEEPVRLGPGYWVLEHPIPRQGGID